MVRLQKNNIDICANKSKSNSPPETGLDILCRASFKKLSFAVEATRTDQSFKLRVNTSRACDANSFDIEV